MDNNLNSNQNQPFQKSQFNATPQNFRPEREVVNCLYASPISKDLKYPKKKDWLMLALILWVSAEVVAIGVILLLMFL